jgi:hypothetical protein
MEIQVPNFGSLVVNLSIRAGVLKKGSAASKTACPSMPKLSALEERMTLAENAIQAMDSAYSKFGVPDDSQDER